MAVTTDTPPGEQALPAARGAGKRLVLTHLRRQRRLVLTGLALIVASGCASAVLPLLVSRVVDSAVGDGDRDAIRNGTLLFVVAATASAVAGGLRTLTLTTAAQRSLHHIREQAIDGLARLGLRRFEQLRRGDLLARLTSDIDQVADLVVFTLPVAVGALVSLGGALVGLTIIAPVLALVVAAAAIPMVFAGRAFRRVSRDVYPREAAAHAAVVTELTESYEGLDTIQMLGLERHRLAGYNARAQVAETAGLAAAAMRNRLFTRLTLIRAASTATMLAAGAWLAAHGHVTPGGAAAAVLALSGALAPMADLLDVVDRVQAGRAALDRVAGLTGVEAVAAVPGGPRRDDAAAAATVLELRGVRYGYSPDRPVVHGVDLRVGCGERVALVGATGSGKTTLARLAAGIDRPQHGTVTVGGVDPAGAAPSERGRLAALVMQDTYLIDGTIAENMRLVAPAASDTALRDAVAAVGLERWVAELPDALDTPTGANGARLSAGQRQLVALLRAAVLDPELLVLDEATSVVDDGVDRHIGDALAHAGGRATLVIAHRASTALQCDRVVVLVGGRVAADARAAEVVRTPAWQALNREPPTAHWGRD